MQDLTIGLVQTQQFWEDKASNLSHFEALIASTEGIDLYILPEMFHTGFSMNVDALAEEMENSLGINWLVQQAKQKQAAFYTSLIIKENNHFFNRGVFVEPTGTITSYDKRKTFGLAGEDQFYTAGNTTKIADFKGWKFQLQICYDLRFPEISRNAIDTNGNTNYDVLLYVANWPERRRSHWKALLPARAIENQCYVIGVNRVGKDGNELIYSGDSCVINMLGETLSQNANFEGVIQVKMNKKELEETRKQLPFLKDI